MSNLYYFAADGSYGHWHDASILADVSQWTEEDWELIEGASDSSRAGVAYAIAMRYRSESPF